MEYVGGETLRRKVRARPPPAAATRARKRLYSVYPLHVYRAAEDGPVPSPSRFLEPVPDTTLPRGAPSGE